MAVSEEPRAPIERRAGRVLVLDPAGRVLLLQGFVPERPADRFWFTVGGGAEPGETLVQTAARELREETGIVAAPDELGSPVLEREANFTFGGVPVHQRETYFVFRPGAVAVSFDGHEPIERETVTGYRWWSADDLDATSERFFPARLPALLRELGRDEPG